RAGLSPPAPRGRLEQGAERVWIEGDVVVVREADAKAALARLNTETLLVLPDEGIARTSSDVTLTSAQGIAHAKGTVLANTPRTIKLDPVRAVYKPAARPAAEK